MAPMALVNEISAKRTSTDAEFDIPFAKRQNLGVIPRHKPAWDLNTSGRSGPLNQDEGIIQSLLTRSIELALEAVGFGAAEQAAMESFRAGVEEYMKNFLADVRQSMLSCRRTQAIPQDFLQALHTHQLSLRSLIVHLDPPVPPSRSQFALESDDTKIEEGIDSPLLAKILGKNQDKQSYSFVPRHFPDFPSKHAYKETPHFPEVERDPRRIRERVIEESRLGEEALRKLFNATSDQFSATQSKSSHGAENVRSKGENLWQEAMLAMAPECEKEPTIGSIDMDHDAIQYGHTSNGISLGKWHVSSAVNADRKYWRKSAAALKRENVQKNGFI